MITTLVFFILLFSGCSKETREFFRNRKKRPRLSYQALSAEFLRCVRVKATLINSLTIANLGSGRLAPPIRCEGHDGQRAPRTQPEPGRSIRCHSRVPGSGQPGRTPSQVMCASSTGSSNADISANRCCSPTSSWGRMYAPIEFAFHSNCEKAASGLYAGLPTGMTSG